MIDVKNADGFAARLFIDEQTNLPLMVTYKGPQARMIDLGGPRPADGGARGTPPQRDEDRKKLADDAQKQVQEPSRERRRSWSSTRRCI